MKLYSAAESGTVTLNIVKPFVKLVLPLYMTEIETEAFMGTNVEMVVLPPDCTHIKARAFKNCTNLVALQIMGAGVSWEPDAFEGCGTITIYDEVGNINCTIN